MKRDEALLKIKKLLALSKSNNENEAALAMERAMKLMQQFDLEEKDVHYTEAHSKSTSKRRSNWREQIGSAIAYLNGVVPVKGYDNYFFVGPDLEVMISCEMYEYLEKAVLRVTKNSVRKNAKHRYRESFRLGIAVNLNRRIREMADSGGWLPDRKIRIKSISDAYSKELTSLQSRKPSINKNALAKGFASGDGIGLNHQVNGGKTQSLIGKS